MTLRLPDDLDIDRLNAMGRRSMVLDAQRARYVSRVERGVCSQSAEHGPAEPGHTMCIGCLVDKRFDQNERNAARSPRRRVLACKICGRAGHNSRSCTQPRPDSFDARAVKNDRTSRYRKKLRERGICINSASHGPAEPGYAKCARCRAGGKAKS